jgi:hypothetical protein
MIAVVKQSNQLWDTLKHNYGVQLSKEIGVVAMVIKLNLYEPTLNGSTFASHKLRSPFSRQ